MESSKPARQGEDEPDIEIDNDDDTVYSSTEEIDMWALPQSLGRLAMFAGDPYLTMQATNLGLIDRWLIDLESSVQRELLSEDRTPSDSMFLSALTQMWLFAAYEVLRTWRQRAKEVLKLIQNSGLQLKIEGLEKELGYQHTGRELRARQLREVHENPELALKIEKDLRRTHIMFAQLEYLRVALAKHEVRGRPNAIAMAPGYGRIDNWTGSLTHELSNGRDILGYISRRQISDAIRTIDHDSEPQSSTELAKFDLFMKGSSSNQPEATAEADEKSDPHRA
ncbi:MAG TPA: hypothetical protein VHX60_05000 [Acidobacteriaceae bacterium]|nr:hypothetical protein [Acidobacteriaceae bacterium]